MIRIFGKSARPLDGAPGRGCASTLVDVSGKQPRLLRRGAVDVTPELGNPQDLVTE
jgi:tRNA A37 threonylcarbamoyladenosine synthetase subunit TsaC/SUA5/YrdC